MSLYKTGNHWWICSFLSIKCEGQRTEEAKNVSWDASILQASIYDALLNSNDNIPK